MAQATYLQRNEPKWTAERQRSWSRQFIPPLGIPRGAPREISPIHRQWFTARVERAAAAAEAAKRHRRRTVLSLNGTRLDACSIATTKGDINRRIDGKTGCKFWWFTHN